MESMIAAKAANPKRIKEKKRGQVVSTGTARRIRPRQDKQTDASRDETNIQIHDTNEVIVVQKQTKKWTARPSGWEEAARYAVENGDAKALQEFSQLFIDAKPHAATMQIRRWRKSITEAKVIHGTRPPVYGAVVDAELYAAFRNHVAAGLFIDELILRNMLIVLLDKYALSGLLRENGGKNTFGHSWAFRFYKRYNVSFRARATKKHESSLDTDDNNNNNNNNNDDDDDDDDSDSNVDDADVTEV